MHLDYDKIKEVSIKGRSLPLRNIWTRFFDFTAAKIFLTQTGGIFEGRDIKRHKPLVQES